ncbi:hypothetical protein K457DRAFT_153601 [Linnemannia elongata AG-77]|uniref:Uncharacterized protein n=1 Tax=Linnemannia elongata AG-77 TaxID=1314771 RepID=A0A197K6R5_9FUNG|nr:hypothetical protein K457DRAFT_153601 [Linnemannia elongata AG-77]
MEQLQNLKRRPNAAKQLFRGTPVDDEPEFLPEEEQEELIESLRAANDKANDWFKFVLLAFSGMEIFTHLVFAAYAWYRRASKPGSFPDQDEDPSQFFRDSISPVAATLFSLISFAIGMAIIKDTTQIGRDSLLVWTSVSVIPLFLMMGATVFSFELLWWSMPLLLQIVDLTSLWVMQSPDEEIIRLENSQYKLKGA